jgi:hypothetical protein
MPVTVADTGLGATISGTGLITTQITRIGEFSIGVDALEITDLAVTGYKKMRPGDLRDLPEVSIEFNWLGNAPPITSAMTPTSEPYLGVTATITYPSGTTQNNGTAGSGMGSIAGSVFVKSVKFPNCAQGEIMKGEYVIQFDGETKPAFSTT